MGNKQIRLGIVGFGRIVELLHLPVLKKNPLFEIQGVFDITNERRKLATKLGFEVYESLENILKSDIDVLLITTTPESHFEIAKQAIDMNKHVLIEKPVTITYKEAIELETLGARNNRLIAVFHNRRFDTDYILINKYIREKILGRLFYVNRYYHAKESGVSFGVKSFYPQWRNLKKFGGGALLDWGVHLIDQLLSLRLGSPKYLQSEMFCLGGENNEAENYVRASLNLDTGILLNFEVNFSSNSEMPLWLVGGENGTIVIYSNYAKIFLSTEKETRLEYFSPLLKSGIERIYQSFAESFFYNKPLAVPYSEVLETMNIINMIQENSNVHKISLLEE
ncbi:Gfo/Idh/MocA family protein [Paenibacillus sp. KN14-4R]|uniref:Gfo/Idh/MocA family protein n=1 Tax=Paenibacillus sp. KN14-4R TaxID=3445773 RepID=UPI003FA178DE